MGFNRFGSEVRRARGVPAGSYTKEALLSAGIWEVLQPKLVYAHNVRQVLSHVETDNADLGFVYRTDAFASDEVAIVSTVDSASYLPVQYLVGIIMAYQMSGRHFIEKNLLETIVILSLVLPPTVIGFILLN